jgi:lipopolysaccharide transport system permease protein
MSSVPPIASNSSTGVGLETGYHGRSSLALAFDDARAGLNQWRLWVRLGWNDIVNRYRRSLLGPLWLTISMAILVVSLGLLYGEIFNISVRDFMPYLCIGMVIWGLISQMLTESGELFTGAVSFIKQIRLPYSIYAYRFVWSRLIILAHNAVIMVILVAWFDVWPGWVALLAIPGLAIIVLNGVFAALTLGMLSARFRDIPQIVASVVQIMFFLTPIMWKAEMLGPRAALVIYNPFYHMVEIVRAPLLGQWPPTVSLVTAVVLTLINAALAAFLFGRFRSRIAYWV